MNLVSIENYFKQKRNADRLFRLLKQHGKYIHFSQTYGYLYEVVVGELDGSKIILEVSLFKGKCQVLGVRGEKNECSQKSHQLA